MSATARKPDELQVQAGDLTGPEPLAVTDLPTLAAGIRREHEAVTKAAASMLQHARRAGELLIQARDQVGPGEWTTWLKANFPGSPRTARLYVQVADGWAELESRQNGNALPLREAARLLAAPKVGRHARSAARLSMELSEMRRRAEEHDAGQTEVTEQSATVEIVNGIAAEESTTLPWPGAKSRRRPATHAHALQMGLSYIAGSCEAIAAELDVPTAVGRIEPEQRAGFACTPRENIALLERVLAELVVGTEPVA